ncbi:zinc/iron-chelating domain-containing protein [Acinetobacter sp. ANC 5054]|uniref:YkgJ family cysteine cluster protein n=1 Tax=Acinetobacter sp. ANC 5054 TaxID=1977877 RepID=UPI000A32B3CE|nr:YkgJ family cysteine cluster protein [Acinetobacter sp. ANC 5054]OTG84518.1 zinc/iron-chelating domain-containing protein [Acinetobacter sp. ANC 5054]
MLSQIPIQDACLTCAAYCAHYRVSFYWAEGLNMQEYTKPVKAVYSCMAGTNPTQSHCIALGGEIGQAFSCIIYEEHSSTYKDVQIADEQYNKARLAYKMIPFFTIPLHDAENDEDFDQVS